MSETPVTDNRGVLRRMIEHALKQNSFSFSKVFYDVSFGFVPNQQGAMQPGYLIAIFVPNPLLGQPALGHVVIMVDGIPTQKTIDELISEGMTALREAKAKILSVTNGREAPNV